MTVKPRLSGLIGQHIKAGEAAPMPTSSKPPGWIFVLFLVFGLPLTGLFGYPMIWRPLRVNLIFVETTCVVLDKKLETSVGDPGLTMRPLIHIEYEAGGRIRQAWTYDASGIFDDRRNSMWPP